MFTSALFTLLYVSPTMNLITLFLILIQEVSDLFGCDLPVEGAEAGVFAWKSGPFLQGLCEGHWIILDEVHTMLF